MKSSSKNKKKPLFLKKNIIEDYLPCRINKIIIDTNILLMYLIGINNKENIHNHPRSSKYSKIDFMFINDIVLKYNPIITTPHILAEISNLNRNKNNKEDNIRKKIFKILFRLIKGDMIEEQFISIENILNDQRIFALGIADVGIKILAKKSNFAVITSDKKHYNYLNEKKIPCVNYNHVLQDKNRKKYMKKYNL